MAEYLTDEIDFTAYMRETDAQTNVMPAKAFIAGMKAKLRQRDTSKKVRLPWDKAHDAFRFRPREVTLWLGQNGHGKTQMTSQMALSLLGQDEKVCIASLEMHPETTLDRLARAYAGTDPFSMQFQQGRGLEAVDELYDEFGGWTDQRLWLYNQTGSIDMERVIGMARYCAKELGITQIFIDSLMKCVQREDDYNGQKLFIDELTVVARNNDVHIHIVHHSRKPANEHQMSDKYDAKGSGAISDLVDNVFVVHRNKAKEDGDTRAGDHDSLLLCRKQRNGDGEEPRIALWFDRPSQQFRGSKTDPAMFFPNFPHRPSP